MSNKLRILQPLNEATLDIFHAENIFLLKKTANAEANLRIIRMEITPDQRHQGRVEQ